ncbi:unnamed protein product [Phaeothamnion confervicola]
MRVLVTVVYDHHEEEYDIAVGDGRKSFKWLATAAAQRFSSRLKSSGRRRHCESVTRSGKMTNTPFGRLLPAHISTENSSFHHPDSLLCDELTDGQNVFITLAQAVQLNEIGSPVLDNWMNVAFCMSEAQRGRRDDALRAEMSRISAARAEQTAAAAAHAARIARGKAEQMRAQLSGQMLSREKVDRAFAEDWRRIDNPSSRLLEKCACSFGFV